MTLGLPDSECNLDSSVAQRTTLRRTVLYSEFAVLVYSDSVSVSWKCGMTLEEVSLSGLNRASVRVEMETGLSGQRHFVGFQRGKAPTAHWWVMIS